MIKKSAKQIADANQYGWGSLVLMEIIERGIADLQQDSKPHGFDPKTRMVQDVIELLEVNGITPKLELRQNGMDTSKPIVLSNKMVEVDIDENIDQRRF